MDLLSGLNDRQRKGVLHTEGPLLIIAGAGSGKTKVVTTKIAYLIEEKNIYPSNILAITFTNKAAREMKDRVAQLLNTDVESMWIGTFHSICVRILRRHIDRLGYERSFTIYDRDDQKTLIKECIREKDIDKEMYKDVYILSRISDLKDRGTSPQEYINESLGDFRESNIAELYDLYQKKLKKYNSLDFDDLIIKTVELFEKNLDILEKYQEQFKYVFVDEYQDTNKIQYRLVRLLSDKYRNISVVGDDNQSIYSWRGADIRNILEFERDFKGGETILLEQNYRSSQNILDVANRVIENNQERKEKNLWTEKEEGNKVVYRQLEYSDEEASYVAQKIHHLRYKDYRSSDIAILYRTNAQSRIFEEMFMRESIPYKIVGGLKFYDRKEVKDIIAYLKVIENPSDNISLKRIINTPKRGIGNSTIEKIEAYAAEEGVSIYEVLLDMENSSLSSRLITKLKDFRDMISLLMAKKEIMGLKDFIEDLIAASGYIDDLRKSNTVEDRTRIENIREFVTVALNFEKTSENPTMEDFLASVSLLSDVDKTVDGDNLVTMMTVHSAKGLEFKNVFLVGMEEGLFPISRSLDNEEDLEEERRLCYVAVTRAEENLFITNAKKRTMYGNTSYTMPSRFIDEMGDTIEREIPKERQLERDELLKITDYTKPKKFEFKEKRVERKNNIDGGNIRVGDKVEHKKWGIGTIVSVKPKDDDSEISIAFEKNGIKRLLLSFAPIEILK